MPLAIGPAFLHLAASENGAGLRKSSETYALAPLSHTNTSTTMKYSLLVVGLGTVVSVATAQPVIDASHYLPTDGGELQVRLYDVLDGGAGLDAILAATGPNQTYDFSQFNYGPHSTLTFEIQSSADGTPGALDATLNTANYVQIGPHTGGTLGYNYYVLDETGYRTLGNVIVYDSDSNGVDDTTYSVHSPPQTFAEFPLTEGTEWTETITTTTQSVFGPGSSMLDVHGVVEGWGDLVLPDRTLPAVRVRRSFTQTGLLWSLVEFKTAGSYTAQISVGIGGGLQSATYSFVEESGSTGTEDVVATDFALLPAYPNPANATTTIPIEVSTPGAMRVVVFDLLGREVLRPLDGFVAAGRTDVQMDTDGLPGGVYVYRVSSGSGERTGRLVVR